ncbi:MAG: hypothetical protein ACRDKS_11200 [Actinomycetota bacterium]
MFPSDRSSSLALYSQLITLQRNVPRERVRPPSVLLDPEAGLRIQLLRAGAAWLIGWASLMVLITWVQ